MFQKKGADDRQIREFIRKESTELVAGLERHNIFYDKYRLRLTRVLHAGTQGELQVEDVYGRSQHIVAGKRVMDKLLHPRYDNTPVEARDWFSTEPAVMQLVSSLDVPRGATGRQTTLELNKVTRGLHVYVKEEKLARVEYLVTGKPLLDPQLIAQTESLRSEGERFLKDPLIRALFPQPEGAVS